MLLASVAQAAGLFGGRTPNTAPYYSLGSSTQVEDRSASVTTQQPGAPLVPERLQGAGANDDTTEGEPHLSGLAASRSAAVIRPHRLSARSENQLEP
jgi:hypothetical protein